MKFKKHIERYHVRLFVSFDIKFIRQDQKQHRNGEAYHIYLAIR